MNIDELSGLSTPGPTVTQTSSKFWESAKDGLLMIQNCSECDHNFFYPRTICPKCWSQKLVWKEASGKGRLKSYSVVHKPGHPAWEPATPYVVGLVEIEEGPTLLSIIVTDSDYECNIGEPLLLAPTNVSGRVLPAFKPVGR